MVGRSVPPQPGMYTLAFDRDPPRPAPPLALCPLCELPRASLHTFAFLGVSVMFSSCECATREITVLPDGVRAIPMTENHDPGDEDRSC